MIAQRFTIVALFLFSIACTSAQASGISVRFTESGLYKLDNIKEIEDASTALGRRHTANATLSQNTDRVPLTIGTSFGITFVVTSASNAPNVKLRKIMRFPSPGLKNLQTGKTKSYDEAMMTYVPGQEQKAWYTLEEPFELVPGVWKFELWDGNQKIGERAFTLSKP